MPTIEDLNIDPWLTPAEVEIIYRYDVSTLCMWRKKRQGPAYRQVGRTYHYRKSVMDAFDAAHIMKTAG